MIDGLYVAGGMLVGVDLYAAGRSRSNFVAPSQFVPERWLKDAPEAYREDKLKSVHPVSFVPSLWSRIHTDLVRLPVFDRSTELHVSTEEVIPVCTAHSD